MSKANININGNQLFLTHKIGVKKPLPIGFCSRCCASWTESCHHWTKNNRNPLHRTAFPLGSIITVYFLSADFFSPIHAHKQRFIKMNNKISFLYIMYCVRLQYSLVSLKYNVVNSSKIEINILIRSLQLT